MSNSKKIVDYLRGHPSAKLHIGCGRNLLEGWLNTDIRAREEEERAYLDAACAFPLPSDTFEYVYSEHLFEHLKYGEGRRMLYESHRVLKPNGVIRIATPDLNFLMDLYANPDKPINRAYLKYISVMSGLPPLPAYAISYFHNAWGHQIIYDPASLRDMLAESGFSDIRQCKIGESEHEALKNIERHQDNFTRKDCGWDFNSLQTMVFEGTKR